MRIQPLNIVYATFQPKPSTSYTHSTSLGLGHVLSTKLPRSGNFCLSDSEALLRAERVGGFGRA
jgi:curli biogenesis system outer membrane secretion channel CsgG